MGYYAIHRLLDRTRGRAKDNQCQCGAAACDWAYQPNPANEQFDKAGRPYSDDPDDYLPMCRSCHLKLDAAARHISKWGEEGKARFREGQRKGALAQAERMKKDPAYKAKMLENLKGQGMKIRRRCGECDMVTHAAALGNHQKASGHKGWSTV